MNSRLALLAACLASQVSALAAITAPPGGEIMLGSDSLAEFKVISEGPHVAKAGLIEIRNGPTPRAWRLETLSQPAETWKFQLQMVCKAPAKRGDTLWAHFFIRSSGSLNETGEGHATFVFESADVEHVKSIDLTVSAGDAWREFYFPFTCRTTLAVGDALINLRAGFRPQTIEIGGVEVLNYGPGKSLDSLPRTRVDYPGRAADAPWRNAAAARIEKIRKGDFTVKVVDATGRPVPDAKVELDLHRHAFGFGSAIDSSILLAKGQDADRYREVIDRSFSRVVYENELKWQAWEPADKERRERSIESFDWFEQRGIKMRGHVLLWPSWQYLPESMRRAKNDPSALRRDSSERIREMMTLTHGRFHDWDVINEPYAHHDLMTVLGDSVMVDWFKQARAIDPDVVLFLNDYAGLAAGGMNTRHKDHFEKTVRFLKEQGAPIGGVGLQCHFGWSVTPPELALKELDRWGALGLEVQLTEFDIDSSDELLQADYTRDLLTLAFSHSSVTAVMTWGFWEGRHWRPDAALFRRDWSLKPNGKAWMDLTTRDWWTRASGVTRADGRFTARGFFGDYDIKVTSGDRIQTIRVHLAGSQADATVALN